MRKPLVLVALLAVLFSGLAAPPDGAASFCYLPYLGTSYLDQVVTGIQAMGFRFVNPTEIGRG